MFIYYFYETSARNEDNASNAEGMEIKEEEISEWSKK